MMVPYALCLMSSVVFVNLISSSIINAAEIYKQYHSVYVPNLTNLRSVR
jgi:hypothetical protein